MGPTSVAPDEIKEIESKKQYKYLQPKPVESSHGQVDNDNLQNNKQDKR